MNERVFKHTEAHKLEDPERLKWLPPEEVLLKLQLTEGMKVADIGAGTGYFSIPIAKAVGASGHVFAVDLQPEMLKLLSKKLDQPNASHNISLHQGAASHLPLPAGGVDLVFYANIWHELDHPDSDFAEALRIAETGGRIAILDWRADQTPPPGPPRDHRISTESVSSFLTRKECGNVRSSNVGQYGYLVIAELGKSKT